MVISVYHEHCPVFLLAAEKSSSVKLLARMTITLGELGKSGSLGFLDPIENISSRISLAESLERQSGNLTEVLY